MPSSQMHLRAPHARRAAALAGRVRRWVAFAWALWISYQVLHAYVQHGESMAGTLRQRWVCVCVWLCARTRKRASCVLECASARARASCVLGCASRRRCRCSLHGRVAQGFARLPLNTFFTISCSARGRAEGRLQARRQCARRVDRALLGCRLAGRHPRRELDLPQGHGAVGGEGACAGAP